MPVIHAPACFGRRVQGSCLRLRRRVFAALAAGAALSPAAPGVRAATLNVPGDCTIAAAIAAAAPGDTILVADGVYTDAVTIDGANGTSAAPITIKAATVGGARVRGFSANSSGNSKWTVNRSWWIIDGFRFGGTTPDEGIMTSTRLTVVRFSGATNTTLRRCYFENCGSTLSNLADQANTHLVDMLNGSASNVVERCEVKNSPSTGFHVVNTGADIYNVDNTFRYNFFTGNIGAVNGSGDSSSIRIGIGTDAAKANPTNALIEHNLWKDVVSSQVLIYLKCSNNTVSNNSFRDCAQGVTARRGPSNNFLGNYFFNSGGIRMREGGSSSGGGHTVENNYIEGALLDTSKKYRGIQVQAGQLEDGGNSGHVAMKYSTVRNNTVVYTGDHAFTFGNDWNTTSVECNIVVPYENKFLNNLFVNDAGQGVYRFTPSSPCNSGYDLTCPDPSTNVWCGNVVWSVGSGTPGYSRSGLTSNVDPQLTRDAFSNWVGSLSVAGVIPGDYGAHPPYRPLTTADVGPNSTYIAGEEDITNGLVGGWKFDEPNGSTTTADFSANGFTATIKNAASIVGGTVDFDGGTELADLPYNVLLQSAQFSVSLWAKTDALQPASTALFKSAGGDGLQSGFALMQTTSGAAFFRWSSGSASDGSLTSVDTGAAAWWHIVGTYDGSEMRLYVNAGTPVVDTTVAFGYNATPSSFVQLIGDSNGVANFVGQIDDVRVYNRALLDTEVSTLFANGPGSGGNNPPTISNIVDQTISEDGNTGALAFTVGDADTAAGSITLTSSSSNTTLVPNNSGNIAFGGSGENRTVTVTPASDQSGTATITVTVTDGIATVSDTLVVTVNAVNDAPTISNIADQTIDQDTSTCALAFTVGDVEMAAGSLTLSSSSSNTTLVPNNANITLVAMNRILGVRIGSSAVVTMLAGFFDAGGARVGALPNKDPRRRAPAMALGRRSASK